nr:hypothetical protein [Tanacetum cinerariifolium]
TKVTGWCWGEWGRVMGSSRSGGVEQKTKVAGWCWGEWGRVMGSSGSGGVKQK